MRKRKPNGYWDDFANLRKELSAFIQQSASPSRMPTGTELAQLRRGDIAHAIHKHGGYHEVGRRLKLEVNKKREDGYWENPKNVEGELLAFIQEHGTSGVMPSYTELRNAGYSSLSEALAKHGGFQLVRERLGLEPPRKPPRQWDDFETVKRELLAFIQEHGTPGVMPTDGDLRKVKKSGLAAAFSQHGGFEVVRKRLGLQPPQRPPRRWDDFETVKIELLAFIQEHGTPGVMPTNSDLRKAKRSGLAAAFSRYGGSSEIAKRLGLTVSHESKPLGYWETWENLEKEITHFNCERGMPGVMPTQRELQQAGLSSLCFAMQKHGGQVALAERLGFAYARKRKESRVKVQSRKGYWSDFANVKKELLAFIDEHGTCGIMPNRADFANAGRGDLTSAIKKYGGLTAVGKRLSLKIEHLSKPPRYWEDRTNLNNELVAFIQSHGTPGVMPTQRELTRAQRSDLVHIIHQYGGHRAIAEQLGLKLQHSRRSIGHWDDFENVKKELLLFNQHRGKPGVMPLHEDLQDAGLGGLSVAISKHGGPDTVAQRLGLTMAYQRNERGHWETQENVDQALLDYIQQAGSPGKMPSGAELEAAGRKDLIFAIAKYGGYSVIAERLKLEVTKRPNGYWDDFANIKKEILSFNEARGKPGIMPTGRELQEQNLGDLAGAMWRHGGFPAVAEKLGFKPINKPRGYWDDFENLKSEILLFNEQRGMAGTMPTVAELTEARLSRLAFAIGKHGGFQDVAERLGLSLSYERKPTGYWDNFENVANELRRFIEQRGKQGVMPTQRELHQAGFSDLNRAIQQHGGFQTVAHRLTLLYTGPQYIRPKTAEEIEKTARAIQPLAESNLLSGAQIMIILRRAGLLEFRNKRVVRLNAGLMHGDHNAIETALTQLPSDSEELPSEPPSTTGDESNEIAALEVTRIVEEDLADDERPSVPQAASSSAAPNIQREQSVIRGLSALGDLRLPLDEILTVLSSKILWEAFYRRLYTWYGSLDAVQNVSSEDVEAAILSAYPEHRHNDFVSEASSHFVLEVEEAVNFAASLSKHGWQGPRLRLHQADAARRMAAVLSGHKNVSFLLNADDPGMGKSASFLAAICVSNIQTVMLIAPKTVADDTWCAPLGEIRRCLPHARIVRGMSTTCTASLSSQQTFFVLHYEELLNEAAVAELARRSFDCLCLDEVHFVKQRAGQESTLRRTALEALRASARTAIGLTGTPLINELAEPISLLQILSQHAPQFDHSRLSNRRMQDIADVFEALLPHITRRRKKEVLLHLPSCDIQLENIPLPPDLENKMLDIYGWPRSQATQALLELRKLSIEAKLSHLLERAQASQKLLILTYLTDEVSQRVFSYLEDFFPEEIAHIDGATPQVKRQQYLDAFRSPQGLRILVGTIGTIGTGLTLFDPTSNYTANQIVVADLPYTWAEFEQGMARLHREGQQQRVLVEVPLTTTSALLRDSSPVATIDERIWELIEGKRKLSDVAVDGRYDTRNAASKVQRALRRWLKQAREIGVEPLEVDRRAREQTPAQKWRAETGRLRGMSAVQADKVFADPTYTHQFLEHLKAAPSTKLSHQWLRGRLSTLLRPDLTVIDMGCGMNPFADLQCQIIGLDRHDLPGQLQGKMENPPFPDNSADVLIYSLSLYGTAADLFAYFTHATRILRGGGHLFIVEPDSSLTTDGLASVLNGLQHFGFELVGTVKDLRGEEGTLLKGMHLTLTGEKGKPEEKFFERKGAGLYLL